MNEPIINPWWFYLASVCDKVLFMATAVLVASFFISIWCGLGLLWESGEEHKQKLKWLVKKVLFAVAVAATLTLVIPNKETVISMVVASVVTNENVKMTREEIISLISDVRNAVAGMERERK